MDEGEQLKTARSIDILFRFLLRERLKHAIYLVYFHMERSLARSQRRSRASVPSRTPPLQLFPFHRVLHPARSCSHGPDGFSHTITIDLHRTNIRIFVIPFAQYWKRLFIDPAQTYSLVPVSPIPSSVSSFRYPTGNWCTREGKKSEGEWIYQSLQEIFAASPVLIRVKQVVIRELGSKRTLIGCFGN